MKEKIENAIGLNTDHFYKIRKEMLFIAFKDSIDSFNLHQEQVNTLNELIEKIVCKEHFELFIDQSSPLLWNCLNSLLKNSLRKFDIETDINLIMLNLFDYCIAKKLTSSIDFVLDKKINFYFFSVGQCISLPANINIQLFEKFNQLIIKFDATEQFFEINDRFCEKFFLINSANIYFLEENNISKDIDIFSDKILFEEKLSQAFEKIGDLDKSFCEDILNLCRLYFPIKLPAHRSQNQYSASFSLHEFIGAIFLSKCANVYWLCETIIHEYAHNLLNLIMLYDPLMNNYNKIYYSPWKNEPRSAHGLLHALFSFCLAITFIEKFMSAQLSPHQRDFISERLLNQSHRINIGFQQHLKNDLNSNGKLIYDCIENHFMQSEAYKFLKLPCPKDLRDHQDSRKLKPTLVSVG